MIEHLKWEIGLLIDMKFELGKLGRTLEYDEDRRLKELRERLDSQTQKETDSESKVQTGDASPF